MKSFILFIVLTLGFFLKGQEYVNVPVSGVFQDSVLVEIYSLTTDVEVYYTFDGNLPTVHSKKYTTPFVLRKNQSENKLSEIPTNPSFSYPKGRYDSLRSNNRGWLPPYSKTNKGYVLRGVVLKQDSILEYFDRTYLIEEDEEFSYNIPIVSLIVDSADLFGDDNGIYVFGNSSKGNYTYHGDEWERSMSMELIDSGKLILKEQGALRIHGGGGRHAAQKALRLYADDYFEHDLFKGLEFDKFKRLLLRGGGHRPDCIGRDDLAGSIMKGSSLDYQTFENVVVFINGEYWGLHSMKERFDPYYFQYHYRIDRDEVAVLNFTGDIEEGITQDSIDYENLLEYVVQNDLSQQQHFAYINTLMDCENFVDYQLSEIYFANADWINSNVEFWKRRIPYDSTEISGRDGRWRWLFYDIDGGFGGSCGSVFVTMNGLQLATSIDSSYAKHTSLLRGLLENDSFKNRFIQHSMTLMNTQFREDRTRQFLTDYAQKLDDKLLEHIDRWRYPSVATTLADRQAEIPTMAKWDTMVIEMDTFFQKRRGYMVKHFTQYFGNMDTVALTIDVNDSKMGSVSIYHYTLPDSINFPWTGLYYDSIPIELNAQPKYGYKFIEWSDGVKDVSRIIELNGDGNFVALFEEDAGIGAPLGLKLNEVQPSNKTTIYDKEGDSEDWIELYNPYDEEIYLSGYYLSDKKNDLLKYQIPLYANSKIEPKGYAIVWADKDEEEGFLHANFKLDKDGESVYLSDRRGILIDSLNFGEMESDEAYGFLKDGIGPRAILKAPTPNASNNYASVSNFVENGIKVFPNPFKDLLYLKSDKDFDNLIIWTINGQKVLTISIENRSEIKIPQLQNGVFLLEFRKDQNSFFKKMIKY